MEAMHSTSSILISSTSMRIDAAKARLKRSHQVNTFNQNLSKFFQNIFRVQRQSSQNASNRGGIHHEDDIRSRVVQQLRAITWPEITSLVRSGLSGYWSLAIFLIVGHAAAHITGPSIVVSVIIAAITSTLSGLCLAEFLTRPDTSNDVLKQNETSTRNNYSPLWKSRRVLNGQDNPRINHNRPQLDSLEIELDENEGDEKYLVSVVYASLGELPAFLFGWVEILINVTTVSACSRAITSTVDKTTNNRLHDLVLDKFGMTPYINTYPDFLAGALVMSFALLVAAGLDRSKTLQRWINCLTCSALVVVLLIGAWDSNLEIYKKQAFLFNGSHGVILSSAVLSVVFGGNYEIGRLSQSSAQPHRLIPTANGLTQLIMAMSMLVISLIMPFVSKLSDMSLIAEVPLLQIFDSDIGDITWIKLLIAVLSVLCLCSALLDISLVLHKTINVLSRSGLIPRWLSKKYSRTDTPFFGCAFIGSITAVLATLGDTTRLLIVAATAKVSLDLMICCAALSTRYGLGSVSNSSFDNSTDDNKERKSGSIKYPRNKCRQKKKSGRCNKTKRSRLDDLNSRDKNALHSLSVNGTTTDAKVSNGYSKLANCQLGGSGFQIKTRKRPSRTQKKKSSVHKKENEIEITRNKRCSKNIKTSQCCPQDETTSEGLFALPKVLLNKLYKKVLKVTDYGQLDSSTDEPISRENVNVGPNRISVLNQDVSNGDVKDNSVYVDIDFSHIRENHITSHSMSEDDECHSDGKTESSLPPSGYCTNEYEDSLSDSTSDSDINEEDTSDTDDDIDSEDAVKRQENSKLSGDDKTDEDTDIERAIFEYYSKGSERDATVSIINGAHKMLQNGLTRERLSNTAIVSSSASTDNDVCAISSTTENDGMPSSYCLDNNFSSVFANRKMDSDPQLRLHCKSSSNSNNNHCKKPLKQQCARRKNTPRNELEKRRKNISPTCKSVKKVIFLLLCLVLAFGIQNVIFSSLKNTSSINSPTQVFFMNLIMCLIIFSILLAINKQPKQKYFDNASFHSSLDSNSSYRRSRLLENNKRKISCVESRLFCTSLFCCCYCCFNFSEEDDKRVTRNEISHQFRKSFVIPIAPWIHAIAIFLNMSLVASVLEITWPESISWVIFGFVVYFSYGINHSNAASEEKNNLFECKNGSSKRALNEKEQEMRSECLLLSRRQNGFKQNRTNEAGHDDESHDSKNYQGKGSKNIIKNYSSGPNSLMTSVNNDIPLDDTSHISLEPHI